MAYALRTFTCSDCPRTFQRRAPAGSSQRCTSCAIQRSVDNSLQLHQKAGPWHDRWAAGVMAYADRLAASQQAASQSREGG